jgi:hypothetical protein
LKTPALRGFFVSVTGEAADNEAVELPALTPEEVRELAALRRRAYGPDADIGSDPPALARLEQLQRAARPGTPEAAGSLPAVWRRAGAGPFAAAPDRAYVSPDPGPSAPAEPAAEFADGVPEVASAARGAWLRSIPPWAFVVAASAVLVSAAVVWGALHLAAPRSDLTLEPVAGAQEAPAWIDQQIFLSTLYDLDGSSAQRYEDFRTLEVWTVQGKDGARCLALTAPRLASALGFECSPVGLDPTVDLSIWPGMDENITQGLSGGSAYRFVLHGGLVHVWVRSGSPAPPEP